MGPFTNVQDNSAALYRRLWPVGAKHLGSINRVTRRSCEWPLLCSRGGFQTVVPNSVWALRKLWLPNPWIKMNQATPNLINTTQITAFCHV